MSAHQVKIATASRAMALIVQKYGGTSVGSVERIQAVARRIAQTAQAGNAVVVVVSAMGKTTDRLIKLAREITKDPSRREMDMLLSTGEQVSIALVSMALHELGQAAVSLTGAQVGIVTEAEHSRARILHISTERIQNHLKQGQVVVIAGFQGVSSLSEMEITTLGRGGSDTSAVAVAAALQADLCEIYTDVPGILTTDPRLVPDARLMTSITCNEMLELASLGAKVLHPRAVEIARNYGVLLTVRSSWTDDPGTQILAATLPTRPLAALELNHPVDAVAFDRDQAKVALLRVPDRPGVASQLFGAIAQEGIDVDLVIQSIYEGDTNDIVFTVPKAALDRAKAVAQRILPQLSTGSRGLRAESDPTALAEVHDDPDIAKVSIIGAGMIGRPGVAAHMFSSLAQAGINIQMISTSEVQVSCVVAAAECDRAIAVLCEAFQVNSSPVQKPACAETFDSEPVRGVALDLNQARLALRQVPDRPGIAARIFQLLADANISVDTIIQSQRQHWIDGQPTRDIAFTIAQQDAEVAQTQLVQAELTGSELVLDPAIAKVSIVGNGMVNHPGVAACMFAALAEAEINIEMIATSEIKVSCVIAEDRGAEALRSVHRAFNLAGTQSIQVPA